MKNYIKYVGVLAIGLMACEPEFETPVDEKGTYSSGEVDFSNYVALGNSLTAGFADNALYITGQENSFPSILAEKFSHVGGGAFTQPLMADNAGGLLLSGQQIADTRLVLNIAADGTQAPVNYRGAQPTTEITNKLQGPFNNMGVPGAKSFHLAAPGYGNVEGVSLGSANPYFARFASTSETSVITDAVAQDPTFFSLWIGSNDVLGYATSGGVGEDQTGNMDPTSYGSNDITDPQVFAMVYSGLVEALVAEDAAGVLINIPPVTAVPYFNTVPNNALDLDAETAASLTAFFGAVELIFSGVLMQQGVPAEQARALASQYGISFNEGPNLFLIDVPETPSNPLGFRQMTQEELLLLTIDQAALAQGYGSVVLSQEVLQVLGALQQGATPTPEQAQLVLDAINGIDDGDVLDIDELEAIETATDAYNTTIQALAEQHGLAYLDTYAFLSELAEGGISYEGGHLTADFGTGGVFSLDGIHLTPRGNALVANRLIQVVQETYGAELPRVDLGNYATVTPSND